MYVCVLSPVFPLPRQGGAVAVAHTVRIPWTPALPHHHLRHLMPSPNISRCSLPRRHVPQRRILCCGDTARDLNWHRQTRWPVKRHNAPHMQFCLVCSCTMRLKFNTVVSPRQRGNMGEIGRGCTYERRFHRMNSSLRASVEHLHAADLLV